MTTPSIPTPPDATRTAAASVAATAVAASAGAIRTPWREFWRKFKKQHVAVAALAFVLLLVAVAALAPYLVPFDAENYFDYDRLNEGPSALHWFGVDPLGRDIFSRILMGARISLAAGFLSVLAGGAIGTVLGLLAGYYEGWWDRIVMRISDVLFAFPGILLALGVVAILGSSMTNVVVAVAVFSVPAFARLVRGNTLVLKQMTYIESARSIGASDWTIIARHILPGTISSIVVYFTMRVGTSIITAASLSFLGMGAQPPTPEWGAMLNEARADMVNAPHVALFPSLAIFFTVLAFNLLGDGLRDALDPKIDRQS
jgi:glutathione transport system permease protein